MSVFKKDVRWGRVWFSSAVEMAVVTYVLWKLGVMS